jgi:hypothetical protein
MIPLIVLTVLGAAAGALTYYEFCRVGKKPLRAGPFALSIGAGAAIGAVASFSVPVGYAAVAGETAFFTSEAAFPVAIFGAGAGGVTSLVADPDGHIRIQRENVSAPAPEAPAPAAESTPTAPSADPPATPSAPADEAPRTGAAQIIEGLGAG